MNGRDVQCDFRQVAMEWLHGLGNPESHTGAGRRTVGMTKIGDFHLSASLPAHELQPVLGNGE
jgi:hypothetical protein